jgi:hypothetical protein
VFMKQRMLLVLENLHTVDFCHSRWLDKETIIRVMKAAKEWRMEEEPLGFASSDFVDCSWLSGPTQYSTNRFSSFFAASLCCLCLTFLPVKTLVAITSVPIQALISASLPPHVLQQQF